MTRRVGIAPAALWLAAAIAAQTGSNEPAGPSTAPGAASTATGRAFAVTCHGGDQTLAARALQVVEPVWPLVCEFFGVADAAPGAPLAVHLYRNAADYLAADRERTGGRFQPNLAMFHWATRSAHVALQPPCGDRALHELGLPLLTEAMLAWEATHAARSELCAGFREHAGWFQDGLAATTAQRVLAGLHPGLGAQPFFTQRVLRVQQLGAVGGLPRIAELLADDTDELAMRDRYAARVTLFSFLRDGEPRDRLRAFAGTVRALGAGGGSAARGRGAAIEAFADLDAAFAAHVRDQAPRWNEETRSLWCLGDVWQQIAWPDQRAEAWCTAPIAGGAFVARGAVRVLPGDKQQLNFLFGRTDDGWYSLALVAGYGFTVFDYRRDGNRWLRIGDGRQPGFVAGLPAPFAVRARGAELSIELAGRTWQFALPRALPEAVVWGVGAQAGGRGATAGSAGFWQGLTVEGG